MAQIKFSKSEIMELTEILRKEIKEEIAKATRNTEIMIHEEVKAQLKNINNGDK